MPPPRSSCEGLFRVPSQVHPLLLIGPFAKLSNRLKEELTCFRHLPPFGMQVKLS